MSSSSGSYHVDVMGQFADVIGALALAHNTGSGWGDAQPTERHSDLIQWVRASQPQRENWVMQLIVGAATKSNQRTSDSATKLMSQGMQLRIQDPDWFAREMAFWKGDDAKSLCTALEDEVTAALQRKLPAELSAAEAGRWAQELAASLR